MVGSSSGPPAEMPRLSSSGTNATSSSIVADACRGGGASGNEFGLTQVLTHI